MDIQERLDRLAPEELSKQEQDQLRAVLTSTLMLKALRLVRQESEEQRRQFLAYNLGTMEGIHHAVKLQGRVAGMDRALELLGELAGPSSNNAATQEMNNG